MRAKNRLLGPYAVTRLIYVTAAVSLLAGCSDATRLSDPFGSPYQKTTRNGVDKNPTGAISSARSTNQQISSQPLPAPSSPPPFAAQAGAGPQPVAPKPLSPVPTALGNWTSDGGTAITVGEDENAAMLASRYGVPTEALVKTNGYGSADQIQSGSRIVVPVYRANAVSSGLSAAPLAPIHSAHVKADKNAGGAEKSYANKAKLLNSTAKHTDDENAAVQKAQSKPLKPVKIKAAQAGNGDDAEKASTAKSVKKQPASKTVKSEEKPQAAKVLKPEEKPQATKTVKPEEQPRQAKLDKGQQTKTHVAAVDKTQEAPGARTEIKPPPAMAQAPVDQTTTASLPADDRASDASGNPEFRWPAHGRIIQGFKNGGNDGINIAVPEGAAVKAAESGTVAYAGSELKGYGNLVLIKHPNGYVTAYAHNGELNVKRGDQVKRGQTIAKSGQTGNVDSPQLHFELRKGKTPVDPTNYLAGM